MTMQSLFGTATTDLSHVGSFVLYTAALNEADNIYQGLGQQPGRGTRGSFAGASKAAQELPRVTLASSAVRAHSGTEDIYMYTTSGLGVWVLGVMSLPLHGPERWCRQRS